MMCQKGGKGGGGVSKCEALAKGRHTSTIRMIDGKGKPSKTVHGLRGSIQGGEWREIFSGLVAKPRPSQSTEYKVQRILGETQLSQTLGWPAGYASPTVLCHVMVPRRFNSLEKALLYRVESIAWERDGLAVLSEDYRYRYRLQYLQRNYG